MLTQQETSYLFPRLFLLATAQLVQQKNTPLIEFMRQKRAARSSSQRSASAGVLSSGKVCHSSVCSVWSCVCVLVTSWWNACPVWNLHTSCMSFAMSAFLTKRMSCRNLNLLSAKPSFQLWYPGGQRLKVISFSWSCIKSPSKCFSNTEPTTIIASRDEKRCNASVQWTRSVHSSSLRLSDQRRECHGWLLFFAVPALQPDRPAVVHRHPRKQRSAKR